MNKSPLILLVFTILIIIPSKFLLAQVNYALNISTPTQCTEEDNINVPIYGPNIQQFQVIARHPEYPFGNEDCSPDFTNCNIGSGGDPDQCATIYDDGVNIIKSCIVSNWWRDSTMDIALSNGTTSAAHYMVMAQKIDQVPSWPEFLVLYQDGNLRLIPHPPAGVTKVCYGSSVIIGPAQQNPTRPYVEIERIDIDTSNLTINVLYVSGSTATLQSNVNTDSALVDVSVGYPTDTVPLTTFRSMWVADSSCDVAFMSSGPDTLPILGNWNTLQGNSFSFLRSIPSNHNNSSPNIEIVLSDTTIGTGIADLQLKANNLVSVYPNPVQDQITVKSNTERPITSVGIFDFQGRPLSEFPVSSLSKLISIDQYPSGVYLLRVRMQDSVQWVRFVK